MSKRSLYTIVTPLPPTVTRQTAVEVLHNHTEMIELNPLVINHVRTKPPPEAPADEFHCIWYELTDKITYLPGIKGKVNYKACFHDLPRSVQTHVYAPAGLEIKEKWSIGGNEPHEEREIIEIGLAGLGVPRDGLYLREDVDMRCNIFLANFVKKTLRRAHEVLVERLVVKADLADDMKVRVGYKRNTLSPPGSMSPPSHSRHSSTTYSGLERGGSLRSEATSNGTSTTISPHENPYVAELPVGLGVMDPHYVPPLSFKGKGLDQDPALHGYYGKERTRHPSNAFGIPPLGPVEME
ncbi:hypothetical protein AAFC00_000839 [Neodothiora populina]|uniref:DUF7053 domain-containing protein n=1 Tax=Neodothiora populina TaxID=2781224 RepID=A0ABR3PLZ4_9PEZI